MTFKQFVTRQRATIFAFGIVLFLASLAVAKLYGYSSLWGSLFTSLAASSVTIVLTALVIDYLGAREEVSKVSDAAGLAEEEIQAICSRIEWQIARLLGLQPNRAERDSIGNREEATNYIRLNNTRVQTFLSDLDFHKQEIDTSEKGLSKFTERLQQVQSQLEQTLILYEYALAHDLRVRVLTLRRELQTTDRLLSFIDFSETFTAENESLIRFSLAAVHTAAQEILI